MNTSITNRSASPTIYDISLIVLNAQFFANISWIIAAILGVTIGLLQIATTMSWKPLRKMDQSLIIALAVVDCFKVAAFGSLGAVRMYELTTGGNDVGSQRMCMLRLSFMVFPFYTALFMIIMLSLDRLCSLTLPIWYKNRSAKFRVAQILLSCIFGCTIMAALFVGASETKLVPVCAYGTSPTETFLHFVTYFENFCVCFTLAINALSCAILFHKWRKARGTKQSLTAFRKNVQIGALKMLMAIVLVYLITSAACALFLSILNSSGLSESTRTSYAPFAGLFELLRGVLDFPLYVILVRKYRNGFREVVLKRICCCYVGNDGNILHAGVGTSSMGQQHETGGFVSSRRVTRVAACDVEVN